MTSPTIYFCCDSRRREVVAIQSPYNVIYNGIDFLEVSTDQRTVLVHFIHPLMPQQIKAENITIEGGERIRNIVVTSARDGLSISPPEDARLLVVTVKDPGDFTNYTLRLVDAHDSTRPPAKFDPILSRIDFSFKVACPSDFDCQPKQVCPPVPSTPPDISYLAKDYASFRQLMLDRMAKIMPQWQETSPADLGIMLVEVLAYVGDYLSYQQDAVATEAYLGTARRRTSIRRHVRLVDYAMHDGCNARTWVHFEVAVDAKLQKTSATRTTQLLTRANLSRVTLKATAPEYDAALAQKPQVFELLADVPLYVAHNRMPFYTWGSSRCCLPQGATCAWLRGSFPNLTTGLVLILQEVLGPETGVEGDADPANRHAVRLTKTTVDSDPLGGQFDNPATMKAVQLTRIEWAAEDALPFPLCISTSFDNVSVALGNVVAADHGQTIPAENLDPVPESNAALQTVASSDSAGDMCNPVTPKPQPARFRPELQKSPVTFADPYVDSAPATSVMGVRALDKLKPQVTLRDGSQTGDWQAQRDLLASHADTKDFVVEVENDGSAFLRFGDGIFGKAPDADTNFAALYRVGNGASGNIGRDSLYHLATNDPSFLDPANPVVTSLTNPLPAAGGLDPETLEQIRQRAPYAFRVQQRAVTEQDYADIAQRDTSLARANAVFRWTGSWRTVFIAAERKGGAAVDAKFRDGLKNRMDFYRMAGHDVEVDNPIFVPLEIEMTVCVKPNYFASDVEAALLDELSNRALANGRRGVFYPDNFSFGQPVYLSPIYAVVQGTAGVESVRITTFQRQGIDSTKGLDDGLLEMQRAEVARLDNDRNFPEHGVLRLHMSGGR